MGPREPRSTVLSNHEEALVVAFRKHTLLPLDDCLYALQAGGPPAAPGLAIAPCVALSWLTEASTMLKSRIGST
jgi:hypothetical protein